MRHNLPQRCINYLKGGAGIELDCVDRILKKSAKNGSSPPLSMVASDCLPTCVTAEEIAGCARFVKLH